MLAQQRCDQHPISRPVGNACRYYSSDGTHCPHLSGVFKPHDELLEPGWPW
jgi:hypothetical protein